MAPPRPQARQAPAPLHRSGLFAASHVEASKFGNTQPIPAGDDSAHLTMVRAPLSDDAFVLSPACVAAVLAEIDGLTVQDDSSLSGFVTAVLGWFFFRCGHRATSR